jgi:thiol-disulfide isomerase/thioredoxin
MRSLRNLVFVLFHLLNAYGVLAQQEEGQAKQSGVVTLKAMDGSVVLSSELKNEGKPYVLVFWKSCCSPNIKMLDEISEVYSEWKEKAGVVVYAVSIDDSRSSARVAPLVNSKDWEFVVLLDPNSDFKRSMNVIATPHVFVYNGKNELVWQKTTCNPGETQDIFKALSEIK